MLLQTNIRQHKQNYILQTTEFPEFPEFHLQETVYNFIRIQNLLWFNFSTQQPNNKALYRSKGGSRTTSCKRADCFHITTVKASAPLPNSQGSHKLYMCWTVMLMLQRSLHTYPCLRGKSRLKGILTEDKYLATWLGKHDKIQ